MPRPRETERNVGLPTLTFIAFTISGLATLPAVQQFKLIPDGPGERWDANFMGLLQGTILQGLSLGVLILGPVFAPETFRAHAYRATRRVVVATGVLAIVCAFLSLVLYDRLSAPWSGLVAFVGQSLMAQLQLLLAFGPG